MFGEFPASVAVWFSSQVIASLYEIKLCLNPLLIFFTFASWCAIRDLVTKWDSEKSQMDSLHFR